MKNSNALSAVIGGTFFAIPYLGLSLPFLPSLALGGVAFVAGELVFKPKNADKVKFKTREISKILENAKRENKHIHQMTTLVENIEVSKNLEEIYNSVNKIISTVEKDNNKIKNIDNFFDYYLPITVKIIDRYDEIENQKLSSSESKKFIENTNNMIKEINQAFKKILNSLYKSEIIDTDVEMKVFNSMLKSDGFDSNELEVFSKE